jgi:hypothetical protein
VRIAVALVNVGLGAIYTSYGLMTIVDLKRGWRTNGLSHFGLAWIAMAFTCGPHHIDHGLSVLYERAPAGSLDLMAVLVGAPAGVAWFLLRVEALGGGRGDRAVSGTPAWLRGVAWASGVYAVVFLAAVAVTVRQSHRFSPRLTPNILLLGIYCVIGFYLLRTQLANRAVTGGWSVSGLALAIIFPTCGAMHALYQAYTVSGIYTASWHCLTIDWLAVPAAIYFVWVVRSLSLGSMTDWNLGAQGARLQVAG